MVLCVVVVTVTPPDEVFPETVTPDTGSVYGDARFGVSGSPEFRRLLVGLPNSGGIRALFLLLSITASFVLFPTSVVVTDVGVPNIPADGASTV